MLANGRCSAKVVHASFENGFRRVRRKLKILAFIFHYRYLKQA
jgi:hypothetical protein